MFFGLKYEDRFEVCDILQFASYLSFHNALMSKY